MLDTLEEEEDCSSNVELDPSELVDACCGELLLTMAIDAEADEDADADID